MDSKVLSTTEVLPQVRNRPGVIATTLFLLLFSGPPKFRIRDAEASLYGEIDTAIALQIVIWGLAGLWVAYQVRKSLVGKRPSLELASSHRIAILLLVMLFISSFVSLAPTMTIFKVYQMTVELLFSLIFIQRFGVPACLDRLVIGSWLLCVIVTASVWIAPDLVLFTSETGSPRLRGLGITDVSAVAAFSIILLLTARRGKPGLYSAASLAFFAALLFFSLTRSAWLAVAVIFILALLKQPRIDGLRWIKFAVALMIIALCGGAWSFISEYRNPEGIFTLSDRLGLWAYMSAATLSQSPWLGLGYAAATRSLGMEYDPLLGAGHSIFFDVFIGGGLLSLMVLFTLVLRLGYYVKKLLVQNAEATAFAACSLFIYFVINGLIGGDIDTSPFGFMFWCLVTILPTLSVSPATVPSSVSPLRCASC